ncbi:unnamed protein product [Trichobilharzia regenti]|nr:unnamed protein product [Trichobilharzia regenti]
MPCKLIPTGAGAKGWKIGDCLQNIARGYQEIQDAVKQYYLLDDVSNKTIKLKLESRVTITDEMIMNNKFCSKRYPVNNTVSLCDTSNKQTNMELLNEVDKGVGTAQRSVEVVSKSKAFSKLMKLRYGGA